MISSPQENEDIDFEPEDDLGDIGALKAKLKKVRDELAAVKKERAEYLDGWQRAKADMVNMKRELLDAHTRVGEREKENFIEALIPALDGFDMAMQGESWQSVDGAWRAGIESIKAQIEGVLRAHGVETYGKEGESFDPMLHEPIKIAEGGESHTVAKVLRRGYRSKERILRPAQVAIFK